MPYAAYASLREYVNWPENGSCRIFAQWATVFISVCHSIGCDRDTHSMRKLDICVTIWNNNFSCQDDEKQPEPPGSEHQQRGQQGGGHQHLLLLWSVIIIIIIKYTIRSIVCEVSSHHVILSPFHLVILSSIHPFIHSSCHPVILSSWHHVIMLSPYHNNWLIIEILLLPGQSGGQHQQRGQGRHQQNNKQRFGAAAGAAGAGQEIQHTIVDRSTIIVFQ